MSFYLQKRYEYIYLCLFILCTLPMMDNSIQEIMTAFALTMVAGLSTGIGSLIAFLAKKTNTKFLSASLGLSAGVMIYVSFMELMPESVRQLSEIYPERSAAVFMLLAFFSGIALIALIDHFVPEEENPHEIHTDKAYEGLVDESDIHASGEMVKPEVSKDSAARKSLKRTGIMTAFAIGIHNFPEGMAVFTSVLTDIEIAIPIVLAIAIHNIPEGIAVSVPLYHATGDKKKAFIYSFLSGISEPVGAVIGFLILMPFWSPQINALLLAAVSGIMIYISFDELLPSTEKFGQHHWGIFGVILGMALMAFSLLFV